MSAADVTDLSKLQKLDLVHFGGLRGFHGFRILDPSFQCQLWCRNRFVRSCCFISCLVLVLATKCLGKLSVGGKHSLLTFIYR